VTAKCVERRFLPRPCSVSMRWIQCSLIIYRLSKRSVTAMERARQYRNGIQLRTSIKRNYSQKLIEHIVGRINYLHFTSLFSLDEIRLMFQAKSVLFQHKLKLIYKGIDKAFPQHTYGGAGGKRMYSSYSFLTSALDAVSALPRALPRGKDPRYPLYRRLGGSQSRSGHTG
jgi:hypothetical protein